jgi:hypothetical protein
MTYTEAILYMQDKVKEEFNDDLIEIHLTNDAYIRLYFELSHRRALEVVQYNNYNWLSLNGIRICESRNTEYVFKTRYNNAKYRAILFGKTSDFPELFLDQY